MHMYLKRDNVIRKNIAFAAKNKFEKNQTFMFRSRSNSYGVSRQLIIKTLGYLSIKLVL